MHPIFQSPKPWLAGLLAALFWQGAASQVSACQYCRMAATDPEAARMAAQMHSGGFPLDATINQFQTVAPAAVLTAPPAPASIATSAADLPASLRPAAPAAPQAAAPVPAAVPPAQPVRWADAGLLGLLAAGSWFYWRTRREGAPVG